MIVNKPEGLEKEQLCAALLIAEIHETSQIITWRNFSRHLPNRLIFLALGTYVVYEHHRKNRSIVRCGSRQSGKQLHWRLLLYVSEIVLHLCAVTHMNQVVIGGVLRCVEGLWLLGPAGGPRQSLVSWKKEQKTVENRLLCDWLWCFTSSC